MNSSDLDVQTVTLGGMSFVILPEKDFRRLVRAAQDFDLPQCDAAGNRPAVDALRAVVAGGIVQDRQRLGWSQAELARRAGIRAETLNRIESGKHTPSLVTIQKIDAAIEAVGPRSAREEPIQDNATQKNG